ncbi:MAG: DUF11 domain-containing protein [Phycisphaerae bacterium]
MGPKGFSDGERAWGVGAGLGAGVRYVVSLPTRDITRGLDGIGRLIRGGVLNANEQAQLDALDGIIIPVVRPKDPNDKIGPIGIGPHQVVSASDPMEYMVRFENAVSATAPVQELIVVDYLDTNLDWTTVEFKQIAYGDRMITPPANSQSFSLRDAPTNSNTITGVAAAKMFVRITGSVNTQTGRLEWRLRATDTNTLYFPQDALTGFLPPEDGTGRGQGYVRFTVKPKAATPIGTGITNLATIIFDGNDAIDTPPVWNIIGDVPSLATVIAYLPGQMQVGTPFSYTFGLTNNGLSVVTNVALTSTLPAGMSYMGSGASMGTVTVTNGVLNWNVGDLTNGANANLTLTLLPISAGTFTNNLYFSGGSGLAIFKTPVTMTVLPFTPTLGIRLNSGQVELFWPTDTVGFHLQSATGLGPTAAWSEVTNAPVVDGGHYRVILAPSGRSRFVRLVAP